MRPPLTGPAIALVLAACTAPPPSGPAAQREGVFRTLPIGLCEDYPEETRSLERARSDLDLLAARGIQLLRISLGWDGIEVRDDEFDWAFHDAFVAMAVERGIALIPYVCYTPGWAAAEGEAPATTRPPRDVGEFAEFVGTAAARYRDAIDSWELWNEPDNPAYWTGSVEDFAELLLAGAAAVERADPSARVVLGGIAWENEWLRAVLEIDGVPQAVDVVNVHAYHETWSHEPAEMLDAFVGRAADLVAVHGESEPLWVAEIGYSTFRRGAFVSEQYTAQWDHEHTPEYAADHLLRSIAMLAAQPRVELVAWYELRDLPADEVVIGDVNNRHLGVLTADGGPKPALDALVFARELFSEQPFAPTSRVTITHRSGSDVEVRCFERRDGSIVCVAWLRANVPGRREGHDGLRADPRRERIRLGLDAGDVAATVRDVRGEVLDHVRARSVEVELRGDATRVVLFQLVVTDLTRSIW